MLKHKDILEQMTLEEKASLCDGADYWHLKAIERLELDSIMVCDGPHGLRKQDAEHKNGSIGLGNSVPATCFPPACTTACSWDPELLREMVEKTGAHSTDLQSPESVEHLCAKCDKYAEHWKPVAEQLWAERQTEKVRKQEAL